MKEGGEAIAGASPHFTTIILSPIGVPTVVYQTEARGKTEAKQKTSEEVSLSRHRAERRVENCSRGKM